MTADGGSDGFGRAAFIATDKTKMYLYSFLSEYA